MWQYMSCFIDNLIEAIIGSQCFIVGTLVVVLPDHHVADLVLKSLTITFSSLCRNIRNRFQVRSFKLRLCTKQFPGNLF